MVDLNYDHSGRELWIPHSGWGLSWGVSANISGDKHQSLEFSLKQAPKPMQLSPRQVSPALAVTVPGRREKLPHLEGLWHPNSGRVAFESRLHLDWSQPDFLLGPGNLAAWPQPGMQSPRVQSCPWGCAIRADQPGCPCWNTQFPIALAMGSHSTHQVLCCVCKIR